MKPIDYESDNCFLLHQPFFQDGVRFYREETETSPYQALYYEFCTANDERAVTYIPNGCMDILFILDKYGGHMEILGAGTEAKRIHRLANARYFGVRLKPGLYLSRSGMSLREITNQELFYEESDVSDLDWEAFFCRLVRTELLSCRIQLFHSFFDRYIHAEEVNPLTGYILSEINSLQGNIRIHELADDLHYSERHVSRIFLDSMGITPKTFARIVRFQNVIDSILQRPMLSLCEYISELGYSDQAHFQREFKQYTGITPRRFLSYVQEHPYLCGQLAENRQAS